MFYGRGSGIDSLFFCLIELKTLTLQLYICVERKTHKRYDDSRE